MHKSKEEHLNFEKARSCGSPILDWRMSCLADGADPLLFLKKNILVARTWEREGNQIHVTRMRARSDFRLLIPFVGRAMAG